MSCILLQCLTRAAVDLRLTHHPVARIAGEWGYSSHQTFAGGGAQDAISECRPIATGN